MSTPGSPPSISPTSQPTPSASGAGGPPDNPNNGANNSLYLFTFLTTLLLLLAVSFGIVLRSFILRRRFRRRVEAAIAAGVLLPEQVDALRRRGPILGERPNLWEVRIENGKGHKEGYEPGAGGTLAQNTDHDDWANIMPVSAAIIPATKRTSDPTNPSNQTAVGPDGQLISDPSTSSPNPSTSPQSRSFFSRIRRRRESETILPLTALPPHLSINPTSNPSAIHSPGTNTPIPNTPSTPDVESLDKLQLTVLIAMPNPNNRQYIPPSTTPGAPGQEEMKTSDITEVNPDSATSAPHSHPHSHDHAHPHPHPHPHDPHSDSDDEEEEIPEVVFGLTEVLWAGGADWKPGETIAVPVSEGKLKSMDGEGEGDGEGRSGRGSSDVGDTAARAQGTSR